MPEAVSLHFDVWGCRGSRSVFPPTSRIGNLTSCYSLAAGETLLVLDGGRGLAALGAAMRSVPRLIGIRRIHVLITHAHMDHWEGLRDVEWFWRQGNGLDVRVHGTEEALGVIDRAFSPPSFVSLELLSLGTLGSFGKATLAAAQSLDLDGFTVETRALNHYSGSDDARRYLDTVGFAIGYKGARVAYLSDHEPTEKTAAMEMAVAEGAHLVVCDAHFSDAKDHAFGHGSQESAARLARAHPGALVMAAHHNPTFSDERIEESYARHVGGLTNFILARERSTYSWDAEKRAFVLYQDF